LKEEDMFVEPISTKGSGMLTTMTKANGYIIIPEDREGIDEDETVVVHLFAPIAGAKNV
jgi:molybdopterin molybdotransferase